MFAVLVTDVRYGRGLGWKEKRASKGISVQSRRGRKGRGTGGIGSVYSLRGKKESRSAAGRGVSLMTEVLEKA
jgi:hypothetical protein